MTNPLFLCYNFNIIDWKEKYEYRTFPELSYYAWVKSEQVNQEIAAANNVVAESVIINTNAKIFFIRNSFRYLIFFQELMH